MENFHRGPDVSEATKIGEPTLVDPKQASAPDIVREANSSVTSILSSAGVGNTVSVEKVNQVRRRLPTLLFRIRTRPRCTSSAPAGSWRQRNGTAPPPATANTEMKNDLAPAPGNNGPAPVPPPTQVNDLANAPAGTSPPASNSPANASSSSAQQQAPPADSSTESTSKKKKKKHLLF